MELSEQYRKIQQVGEGTFSITLPKNWVIEKGLKRGDLLLITEEDDGSLRIMPPIKSPREFSVTINAELAVSISQLTRLIRGCYIHGYDTIKIVSMKGFTEEQITEIMKTIDELPGLEIVEQTSQKIVIHSFIDPRRFTIEVLMKRLQVIVSSILNQLEDLVTVGDESIAKNIERQEDRVDELYFLMVRLLFTYLRRKELGKVLGIDSPAYVVGARLVAKSLEEISDYASEISLEILRMKRRGLWFDKHTVTELQNIIRTIQELFEKCMKAFFSLDIQLAEEVIQIVNEQIREKVPEMLLRGDPRVMAHARFVSWALSYIAVECKIIAEVIFNKFVRESTPICEVEVDSRYD
ncbi:MAG: PhoU domain-containing protein [Nitrososphaerota archaeon]|nr:hypothetical protein [Candidatus Geocrenenecus dongiae]